MQIDLKLSFETTNFQLCQILRRSRARPEITRATVVPLLHPAREHRAGMSLMNHGRPRKRTVVLAQLGRPGTSPAKRLARCGELRSIPTKYPNHIVHDEIHAIQTRDGPRANVWCQEGAGVNL